MHGEADRTERGDIAESLLELRTERVKDGRAFVGSGGHLGALAYESLRGEALECLFRYKAARPEFYARERASLYPSICCDFGDAKTLSGLFD
jgi:hypothetical protein